MAASFGVGPRKPKPRLLLAKAAKPSPLNENLITSEKKFNAEERMVVQKFHRYFYETFIFEYNWDWNVQSLFSFKCRSIHKVRILAMNKFYENKFIFTSKGK